MTGIHEVIDTLKTKYDQDDQMLLLIMMQGVTSMQAVHKQRLGEYPLSAIPGFEGMIHDKLADIEKYLEEVSGYEF